MNQITNETVSDIDTSSVLSFLAENINIYNWFLLREYNPNCTFYDEYDNTMSKLHDLLSKRAQDYNEVCIKLKNTILKLNLTTVQDETIHQSAYLLSNYIQSRQHMLFNYNIYPDIECILWGEVKNTNPPDLYVKLNKLEDFNTQVISYNNFEIVKPCYNDCRDGDDDYYEFNYGPPTYGFRLEHLELEEIYLMDRLPLYVFNEIIDNLEYSMEDVVNDEVELAINNLIVIHTNNIISLFDCPICFEIQPQGSKCATTTCGHHYCEPCFQSMTQQKTSCAMCRREISEYSISYVGEL